MTELAVSQLQLLNRLLLEGALVLNSRSRQQAEALEAAGLAAVSQDDGLIAIAPRLPGGGTYASPLRIDRDLLDLSRLRAHIAEWHRNSATLGVPRSNVHKAVWHAGQHQRYRCTHAHEGPFTLVLRTGGRAGIAVQPRQLGWFTGQQPVTREELNQRMRDRVSGRPENH